VRFELKAFAAALLLCGIAAPALAGITVSSFNTGAQTNAYAPLDRSAYFATDEKPNLSPAAVDVSADWAGTNIGGATSTWHWISSCHSNSVTSIQSNRITVTAEGSFNYDLATTSDFVDPTQHAALYSPLASSGYACYFSIDTAAAYSLSSQLSGNSAVQLFSVVDGSFFVNQVHGAGPPLSVTSAGVLPAGQYGFSLTANLAAPNLPNGANHIEGNGSFTNLNFFVQVPEPMSQAVILLVIGLSCRRCTPLNLPRRHNCNISHNCS
jgi:hypothetical protein